MIDNTDTYMPLSHWLDRGYGYPTADGFYNWTRPGELRDEMLSAGVIMQVGRRWLMNRAKFEQWCESKAKEQSRRNSAAR